MVDQPRGVEGWEGELKESLLLLSSEFRRGSLASSRVEIGVYRWPLTYERKDFMVLDDDLEDMALIFLL